MYLNWNFGNSINASNIPNIKYIKSVVRRYSSQLVSLKISLISHENTLIKRISKTGATCNL